MRKLLTTAALVMACALLSSVLAAATLIPPQEFTLHGRAMHRALSYLAHGYPLMNGAAGKSLNGLFGPIFGTVYDLSTIAILCMAGACVTIALRDYVPEYLKRFGMELNWARRAGVKMRFFNLLVLIVVFVFHAHIASLQWVYAASVLVLLSGGSLAAYVDLRRRFGSKRWRFLGALPAGIALLFFVTMLVLTLTISQSGLEIAAAFAVGILATSFVSRWIRSTELRFEAFDFVDDESKTRFEKWCAHDYQVLVPHRPGRHSRAEREKMIRKLHRIPAEVPVLLIEVELGDSSDFYHQPLIRTVFEEGTELIRVSRCASVAHVIAAITLEMAKVGRPPEVHFGWSDESPLAANVNFLLFGQGNIPWMVRNLIQRAEPNAAKQPSVIIG